MYNIIARKQNDCNQLYRRKAEGAALLARSPWQKRWTRRCGVLNKQTGLRTVIFRFVFQLLMIHIIFRFACLHFLTLLFKQFSSVRFGFRIH